MLRRTVVAAAAALVASIGLAPAVVAAPVATAAKTDVATIAHRGASAYAPENTLAAVRLGVRMRADLVEIDVQQTKDGELVVIHDNTLARTTDAEQKFPDRGPWRISDFTLAEIRTLDAGSWKAPEFAGERVPTLAEVLDVLQRGPSGLLLEAKSPELYPGITERIADELRARPSWVRPDHKARNLVVQSFNWDFIRDFHDLLPGVQVGVLGAPSVDQLAEVATYSNQVNPNHAQATPEYIAAVHAHGMSINPYTVNDAPLMRTLIDRGVDGIISDRPDVLREEIGKARR
ncbi:glycerophosphoryl diester phosphodiesterase [Saccharopolyspora antimicrobica]|uniref:Glycerophosphoryl diester phosphodiesterase n=1 Tax=Saccharopolyspora antimicrobica TaxID=455193 RepID=A0A1I5JWP7_9PSEU|nr:glycerophosphodiester phosphodiesterase family protein [Saccharopolyspora antimicrobica]RKT86960.1 glycerophosphoryl diester phosphodiesterase [Saccharopolyspora antimicrobica]SFO76801.1 glycerophosphoryl diester phosphodiesterase [Saccharopolyspora antimicrobica]